MNCGARHDIINSVPMIGTSWSGIEVVITGTPRKRFARKRTWVRIPPAPLKQKSRRFIVCFFFFGVRKPPHSFGTIPGQESQKHHAAFLSSLFAGKSNFNAVFIRHFFIGKTLENARFYRIITHEFPHTLRIKGDAPPLTKPLSSDIFAAGHRDRGKGNPVYIWHDSRSSMQ